MQEIKEHIVQQAVSSSKVALQVSVELGCKAIVRVLFYKGETWDDDPVAVKIVICDGEDYKRWGTDDTYLETFVYEKLGLVKV
jgi:hypothetical protein